MKQSKLPCYVALLVITLAAGLILGATYVLTKQPIELQQAQQAENARKAVLPSAVSFTELETPEGLDWLYEGKNGDTVAGYAAQITGQGFGGEIEIVLGLDADGIITGVSVGGSNFSETPGLGAKSKEPAFTGQFTGKAAPLTVIKAGEAAGDDTIDAITSATRTSNAVTKAVNKACEIILAATESGETEAEEK